MSFYGEQAQILGCRVDVVDMNGALRVIGDAVKSQKPVQVITLNAEMIYQAQHSPELKDLYARAELVTPDGIGTIWALRRAGYPVTRRVTGIGITYGLIDLARANGWRIFLLGAEPGVADAVAEKLSGLSPPVAIVGFHHGYFDDRESPRIVDAIRATSPDILLVALGAPRQDLWIARHLPELQVPVCIGVGGTFDVLAGKVKRAPKVWRRLGLEWLYRLLHEPRRIRRQMALPRFAWRVIREGGRERRRSIAR